MNANSRILSEQWAWKRLGAKEAWERIATSAAPDIVVAIVDSGVASNHADFAGRLQPALPVLNGVTRDDEGHGTLLAGTIAAVTNNTGPSGRAPSCIKILPVKCCSQGTPPNAEIGALGINVAANAGAKVIVLSWDCGYNSAALEDAIENARSKGAIVVVAAGNHAQDNDRYPNWPANYGNLGHVVTVMAIDRDRYGNWVNERASFSSFGKTTVHIAAPGVDILSTVPYSSDQSAGGTYSVGYGFHSGTSAATAHVAGLAALIFAQYPTWTAAEVKAHLKDSAVLVPGLKGRCVSGGIAHYGRAICGPINAVTLAGGAPVSRNTQVDVTWNNEYPSRWCEMLKVTFCDDLGNPQSILATGVDNKNRVSGSVRVLMPNHNLPAQQWKLRLSSEQANFYADSDVFSLV